MYGSTGLSRSRVLHSAHVHGKTRPRAAAGNVGGDDEFSAAAAPFYTRLNQRPAEHHFDDFVEGQCQPFYAALSKIKIVCSPEIVRLVRRDATRGETWSGGIGVNCDKYLVITNESSSRLVGNQEIRICFVSWRKNRLHSQCSKRGFQFEVGWQPGNTDMLRQLAKIAA